MLAHSRRKVLHFNVTENPAAWWTAQQIIEAVPWSSAPKYLLRYRDAIYGGAFQKRLHGAPLRVARLLQESRDVEAIKNGCVKRTLGWLEDLAAKQKDKYSTFWNTFSKVLKEGFVDDSANREQLAKLVRLACGKRHRNTGRLAR